MKDKALKKAALETNVETIGKKIRFEGGKLLKSLARPEGFEPPTLRSEVSFNPESPELRQKTRAILQALGDSPSLLFHADSPRFGYKDRYRMEGPHG